MGNTVVSISWKSQDRTLRAGNENISDRDVKRFVHNYAKKCGIFVQDDNLHHGTCDRTREYAVFGFGGLLQHLGSININRAKYLNSFGRNIVTALKEYGIDGCTYRVEYLPM